MESEEELIKIAQWDESNELANLAMQKLRDNYDPTYFFCEDCDCLVCKSKDCCNNTIPTSTI